MEFLELSLNRLMGRNVSLRIQEKKKKKQEEEEKKKKEQEEKDKASKKKGNRKSRGGLDLPSQEEAEAATSQQQQAAEAEAKQQSTPTKSSWSSYLPSLRGRKQITDGNAKDDSKASEQKEDTADSTEVLDKSQEKENSRRWGSYLLKGQGVTSYLPSKGAISAFAAQVSVCFIATLSMPLWLTGC